MRKSAGDVAAIVEARANVESESRQDASYGLTIGTVGAASSRDHPHTKRTQHPTLPRSVLIRGGLSRTV